MCDIYAEYCKLCRKAAAFHLGDFNTDRLEITYICSTHTKNEELFHWIKRSNFPYVVWSEGENQKYVVLSLTENAWKNRTLNHQNIAATKILEEYRVVQIGEKHEL